MWGLASVNVGLLGRSATVAQDWCPCSVPEPLHLMLPLALLANTPVNQGSIGPPVVSISSGFSLFDKAIVLDGYNRWVPVGGWAAGSQTPRPWCHFLNFLRHPITKTDLSSTPTRPLSITPILWRAH